MKNNYSYADYFPDDHYKNSRINDQTYKQEVVQHLNSIHDPIRLQEVLSAYKDKLSQVNKCHLCSNQGCYHAAEIRDKFNGI